MQYHAGKLLQNPAPIYIGTSGWHYGHWKESFYPKEIPVFDWLRFYSSHFLSTEINASFYRLPDEPTLSLWSGGIPDDFVFSVKASRFITHMKRLKDPQVTPPLSSKEWSFSTTSWARSFSNCPRAGISISID